MLKQGIIQPSNSPYAYHVILMKKKDGGWRMCVDYRYLNELTVKNKYSLRSEITVGHLVQTLY
jgi:hypothetical protein